MIVGPIFVLLALVGLAAIFIWLAKLFVWLLKVTRGWDWSRPRSRYGRNALEILEQRFAMGDIDAEEFEHKRRLLLAATTRILGVRGR